MALWKEQPPPKKDPVPPTPPPPKLEDAANPGEALDRWAKQAANFQPPAWKIRVDLSAKTPCHT